MKLRHYLALAAAGLILIGSFFLPNAVAGVTDLRRLDNLIMIDSQSISFDAIQELSLPQRLFLSASRSTEIMPLYSGNAMDFEIAGDRVVRELARFFGGGPFELEYDELTVTEGFAALVIDTMLPALNMIVWQFELYDPAGNAVTVTMDDETGMIVRLIYITRSKDAIWSNLDAPRAPGITDAEFFSAAQSLAELMEAYYGLPVELADYQFSGTLSYYRADITDGGLVIPMYGVVRATNFTMNERV